MDPPPPPPPPPASFASTSSPSSSPGASITMVIITVVGILAAFALLASYYAFVTKCQLLRAMWSRHPPWHRRARESSSSSSTSSNAVGRTADDGRRGLGLPFIRMLPVVKFTAASDAAGACGGVAAPRISVSECAVCLSEFEERERVRLLPNCSHAFHIDCIDTWLQGSARCPFCRTDVTLLPSALPSSAAAALIPRRRDDSLVVVPATTTTDSIVIEVRGERERWLSGGGGHGTTTNGGGGRGRARLPAKQQPRGRKAESVGDEAIDTRRKTAATDEEFAVQPLRRSMSLDSSSSSSFSGGGGKEKQHRLFYVSIQELLAAQRQVVACRDPSSVVVHS